MPDSALPDDSVLTSTFWDTNAREQVVTTCTSGTRPSGVTMRLIGETDTIRFRVYNGSNWVPIGNAAIGLRIQRGIETGTTGADGICTSITFPEVYGTTPAVTAIVETAATTQQDTAQIVAVNTTAVQFRLMRNGSNAGTGQSYEIHWIAIG